MGGYLNQIGRYLNQCIVHMKPSMKMTRKTRPKHSFPAVWLSFQCLSGFVIHSNGYRLPYKWAANNVIQCKLNQNGCLKIFFLSAIGEGNIKCPKTINHLFLAKPPIKVNVRNFEYNVLNIPSVQRLTICNQLSKVPYFFYADKFIGHPFIEIRKSFFSRSHIFGQKKNKMCFFFPRESSLAIHSDFEETAYFF